MNSSALTDTYNLTVTDNPSLTVTLNPGAPISLNPTAEGVFGSQDVGVNVMTTDDKGYTLTMSAATSSLSRSTADSSAPVIETLASATAQDDFPNNRWGFKRTSTKYTDTNFQPMLANYNVPISSNGDITGSNGETSTLTFGVKLNTDIPSGEYSIAINFLAVNNVAPNLYYMQDATPSSLAAAMPSVGDTTVLYDRRDNKEYTIAKLADGKYWMTKNLNLAGGTVLTSEDTDMASDWVLPTANGFQEGNKLPKSSTTGFSDTTQAYIYNSGNNTDDCANGCYSYYSWNAATLGSGADITTLDTDAPYSICPKGWKLPTSRNTPELAKTNSDFYQMAIHYGLNSASTGENPDNTPVFCNEAGNCSDKTIPNFLTAGYYNELSFISGDAAGRYWSSTALHRETAYYLYFASGFVYSAMDGGRNLGVSVRCLFDDTMQSFSSEYADSLAMEESVTLRDARDNQEYTVAKLKDGKVWMTKNLNLAGGTTITPADSDVAEDYTLPASSLGESEGVYLDEYVYNSGNNSDYYCDSTNKQPCYSYYAWYTATANSGRSIVTAGDSASYSICPKGWKIPTTAFAGDDADWRRLVLAYGFGSSSSSGSIQSALLGPGSVPNLLYSSSVWGGSFHPEDVGNVSLFWTSTWSSMPLHVHLNYGNYIYLAGGNADPKNGMAVRCLLRTE